MNNTDKPSNGGPAFPIPDERDMNGCGIREGSPGMSKRDYFAAAALTGLLSSNADAVLSRNVDLDAIGPSVASAAYEYADAMLKAGERS